MKAPEVVELTSQPWPGFALTVGTAPGADVVVPDVGTVYGFHARIARRLVGGDCAVEPIGNAPVRIEREGREFRVHASLALLPGDLIRLGGYVRLRWTGGAR